VRVYVGFHGSPDYFGGTARFEGVFDTPEDVVMNMIPEKYWNDYPTNRELQAYWFIREYDTETGKMTKDMIGTEQERVIT
jgi:hypothetical protein